MNQVIVLVTAGKHDDTIYATVHIFQDNIEALKFCKETNTGYTKYWKNAEIVKNGEMVELGQPDNDEYLTWTPE